MKQLRVLQLISPVGFYGAERWVLALANNLDPALVNCDLGILKDDINQKNQLVDHYPAKAGEVIEFCMSGRFDLSVTSKIADFVKNRKIDVIHTHGYKSDIIGLIAARKAGIKSVSTPHGFEKSTDLKLRLFIYLGCLSFRYFDCVAPLSRKIYDDLLAKRIPKEKLTYIQNGVDLSEVDAYRKPDASIEPHSANGKRIGFAGQMIPRKAVEELLLTFDDLWQEDPSLTLNLLGDGSERQSLEDLAQTLASASNIHFLGFRLDRLNQMRTFDLFAMTSTLEGIPRCLMEAMAMEIPVAAYNIPGVDQLIEHEKTGLLANPGDRKALKSHWKKLLTDDEYARDIAAAGRKFVHEKYSGARMASEYTELFSCLVSGQLPNTYQSGA